MDRLIVLDTETTGIEPSEGHRIIEIGCTEIIDRQINENNKYQQYIQPDRSVGESVRIHGIKNEFLYNQPRFEEIAQEFLEYIEGAKLIIHNAPFDLGFLNNELKIMGTDTRIEEYCPNIIDTLVLAKKSLPSGSMVSLDALCRRYEIDSSARTVHGALLDAQILAQVYLAMTGGQSTLFSDNNSSQKNKDSGSDIVRLNHSSGRLKVVMATEKELHDHNNYFANN